MSTRFTLKPGDYVWATDPRVGGRRICRVEHLYSRGQHEGYARLRVVRFVPPEMLKTKRHNSFMAPVSVLDLVELTDERRAELDEYNAGGEE
jgi:hypothetical protein